MTAQTQPLKAPFPYFGGKSKVAREVWRRFGDVTNYCEPFVGSAAMLLARPQPFSGTETVNDLNAWLSNVWRCLEFSPKATARFADWPVSELDLHARGDAVFYRQPELYGLCEAMGYAKRCKYAAECPCKNGTPQTFIEWCRGDGVRHCAAAGGIWIWGCCSWIGDNWSYSSHSAKRDENGEPVAVTKARPHLGDAGRGVNRQRPHLGDAGQGVNRQLPHLGNAGQGANRQLPHLGNAGRGAAIREYFLQLAARLRNVRVCCGEWKRVCGETPTVHLGLTAVFLDPPYGATDRADCYGDEDSKTVAAEVREWCKQRGNDPLLRIALCGYEGEGHEELESLGWKVRAWKTSGGYASQSSRGNDNCKRERIFFSPHCLNKNHRTLF